MTTKGTETGRAEGSRRLWRIVPLAVVCLALAAFFGLGLEHGVGFENILRHQGEIRRLTADHRLAALGLYIAAYVAAIALSIPASALLTVLGGYLFGWAAGGVAAALSATLGGTCFFLIARTSLGDLLVRRAGGRVRALAEGFRKEAFAYLLFLRLLPVVPFWITNLAAGFFGVRLKTFMVATQIGVLPVSFAFAVAGAGLDEAIARQERAFRACLAAGGQACRSDLRPESLLTPELAIALALLGVLALAPILVRRWRERRRKRRS